MIKDKQAFSVNSTQDSTPVRPNGWYKHPVITDSEIKAVVDVLKSTVMSGYRGTPEGHKGGSRVQKLCEMFRDYFHVKHAIAFNSATSALHASLIACDLHLGDEVIVSPYTFSSSASCALMANCVPVFADVDSETFNITAKSIEKALTPWTKAIIPVHLAGQSCDMDSIMAFAKSKKLVVIEDSAQTLGGSYNGRLCGTMGDVGVFSFNQSKPITTGEGGMAITNDDRVASRLKAIMNHGEVSDPEVGVVGYNYRMTEMVAALAIEQMKKLDKRNQVRIDLNKYFADRVLSEFQGIVPPYVAPGNKHVYYTTMIKYYEERTKVPREAFQKGMMQEGIYMGSGYVTPLYLYPIYQKRLPDVYKLFGKKVSYEHGICPVAEEMYSRLAVVTDILRYPATNKDVDDVIKAMKKVLGSGR